LRAFSDGVAVIHREIRMNRILVAVAVMCFTGLTASAQQNQGRGDPSKDMTNCSRESAGQTTGASTDAKAVEKSAILPSAENFQNSAAPTVQRDGKTVEARPDCPQDAGQPKPKG
jgi:hypothetical protein